MVLRNPQGSAGGAAAGGRCQKGPSRRAGRSQGAGRCQEEGEGRGRRVPSSFWSAQRTTYGASAAARRWRQAVKAPMRCFASGGQRVTVGPQLLAIDDGTGQGI